MSARSSAGQAAITCAVTARFGKAAATRAAALQLAASGVTVTILHPGGRSTTVPATDVRYGPVPSAPPRPNRAQRRAAARAKRGGRGHERG